MPDEKRPPITKTVRLPINGSAATTATAIPPSVTAVIILTEPAQLRMAQVAATSFASQAYVRKTAIVVNASPPAPTPDRPLTGEEWARLREGKTPDEIGIPYKLKQGYVVPPTGLPGVVERLVDPGRGDAELWQLALRMVDADYVCRIRPGEVWHPLRLAFQAQFATHRRPVYLRHQVRFFAGTGVAFAARNDAGVPGTTLLPAAPAWGEPVVVPHHDATRHLSLAFYHGGREETPDQFMAGVPADAKQGQWFLNEEEAAFLSTMLNAFGYTRSQSPASAPTVKQPPNEPQPAGPQPAVSSQSQDGDRAAGGGHAAGQGARRDNA